jgi:hypothetical protein
VVGLPGGVPVVVVPEQVLVDGAGLLEGADTAEVGVPVGGWYGFLSQKYSRPSIAFPQAEQTLSDPIIPRFFQVYKRVRAERG